MNVIILVEAKSRISPRDRTAWRLGLRPSRHLTRLAAQLLLIAFLTLGSPSVQISSQVPDEYQVKAAFLYNFAKFVEWPTDSFNGGSLIVGLVGDDPFGETIDQTMNGKTVNGRQITIRRLKLGQSLRDCHILFISSSERKRLPQILESLKGGSTLTIGEMAGFTQQGGIINLVMENNKVRFEVNTNAAGHARLKISSKLLALAKSVTGEHNVGRN